MSGTLKLHFDESDWERIERDWTAWWAGELQRPLVMIEGIDPPPGQAWMKIPEATGRFPLDTPPEQIIDYYQQRLEHTRWHGDAWPRWWPRYAPGMVAAFLGAPLHCTPVTGWFDSLPPGALEALRPHFDPDNPWWQRVITLLDCAAGRWSGQVTVGFADLGGNLDILASLVDTNRLLIELYDNPEEVERLAQEITGLWLAYYDALVALLQPRSRGLSPWAPIWSTGRTYMLQCDFAYMISPKMFEQFVLPDLATCCAALDQPFYHLDGKGQIVHLEKLLSLEKLRGIQWIPGEGQPPPEAWLALLHRIRQAGKLCQLYVTAAGARTICQELGGKGFALYILDNLTPEEAHEFVKELTFT